MALTKLKQIDGGLKLRQDLTNLQGLTSQIKGNIVSLFQRTNATYEYITMESLTNSLRSYSPVIMSLQSTPNENLVEFWINGVKYLEGKDFTVNRGSKYLTWTNTDVIFLGAGQNVDLTSDDIYIKYYVGGELSDLSTGIKILHQNETPKNIVDGVIYNQGDIIFKVNVTPGSNIGWVCTVGGELGTWNAFGEVVDEDNKTISTNASGDIVIG